MSVECCLVGVPVQSGTRQSGCLMGPDAYRTAGLVAELEQLGHTVQDLGNLQRYQAGELEHDNASIHCLNEIVGWASAIGDTAYQIAKESRFPIFLGGDHSLSIGSVPGVTKASNEAGKEQFVIWLDAHPDFHTLDTTQSGNLHGTPVAYFTGRPGFKNFYPELKAHVPPQNVFMMGIRSVDDAEKEMLTRDRIEIFDMRAIDENGVAAPLRAFLEKVRKANGALHVSLDVDFIDPDLAPAVGTTVPGGATLREAHLIMEMLCDSDLVTSLDLVELNPFLDERGRTAKMMVDLCASLLGRKVFDRPTRSY